MGDKQYANTPAWLRLAQTLDDLDDHGLAAVIEMAKWARANLPAELAMLVDPLDAARDLGVTIAADRKGLTVEEFESVIADALAGGESDG